MLLFLGIDTVFTVVVPENDEFGVTDVIVKNATASVRAEILASHSFAHVEDSRFNPMRASTTKRSELDFRMDLFEDQNALSTSKSDDADMDE